MHGKKNAYWFIGVFGYFIL